MCSQGQPPTRRWEFAPFCESHVHLFADWFNALPGNEGWTLPYVRRCTIEDPTYDPELMCAVQERGDPVGFALGSVAEGKGWVRAFIVHPQRRRCGVGSALFAHLERSFARRGIGEILVGWAVPRFFLPGIDVHYTDAIVFLDRLGYHTDRSTRVNMDVVLTGRDFATDAEESSLHAQGFTVRRGRTEDKDALAELCEDQGHHGWVAESAMALAREPATLFLAEWSGSVLAFAAHSVAGPFHFGPMLTAAHLRGLGLGSVLLKRCLRDWQRLGMDRCEIVWAGPLSFYARSVGATMGRLFWTYRKNLG